MGRSLLQRGAGNEKQDSFSEQRTTNLFPVRLSLDLLSGDVNGFPCRKLDLHESVQRSGLNGVWTIAIFFASGVSLDKTTGRIANPCTVNIAAAMRLASSVVVLPASPKLGAVKTTFLLMQFG